MSHHWLHYQEHRPTWKEYLQDAPAYVIEETGVSKEQLEHILQTLYNHRIIN